MRLLLDTNIMIDYFGERRTFYSDAVKLKIAASFGDVDLWGTANSFTDAFYILRKDHESQTIQELFLKNRDTISICSITSDDIFDAADEKWLDFEDCLIHICAKKIKADYLITRDKDGFARASIPCLEPSEFFAELEEKRGISYSEVFSELNL